MPIRIRQQPLQSVAVEAPKPESKPGLTLVHAAPTPEYPVPTHDVVTSASAVTPLSAHSRSQNFPPPAPPTGEGLLKALNDLWHERKHGNLYMVSRETLKMYFVKWYDGETGKVKLISSTGLELTPSVSEREEAKYYPQWVSKH